MEKDYLSSPKNDFYVTESKVRVAFRLISDWVFDRENYTEPDESFRYLTSLYHTDRLQTILLALFLMRNIHIGSLPKLCELLGESERNIKTAWYRITDGSFIKLESTSINKYEFMVTPVFARAITEDLSYEESMDIIPRLIFFSFLQGLNSRLDSIFPQKKDEDFFGQDEVLCQEQPDLANVSNTLLKQLHGNLSQYPITRFVQVHKKLTENLSSTEELLLYCMMSWFVKHFIKPVDFSEMVEPLKCLYKSLLPKLMERGLVVSIYVWNTADNTASTENYIISPRCAELLNGRDEIIDVQQLSTVGTFTPSANIEEKELFYPDIDTKTMEMLRAASVPSEYERIRRELEKHNYRPCVSALLYGPPGTGKTELVRQIARYSGRGILQTDASKLTGIYVGEGAINYRRLFLSYRYVCAVSTVCPILLMDEADGMLGQRVTQITRSSDKDSNIVQNIILEELNSLPGIVFATTNLQTLIDDAALRRFMIRVEFHEPDKATRSRLWLSRLPSLTQDEADQLAEDYPISGGLIDNVAATALMQSILFNHAVSASDLASICESQGYKKKGSKRIGF